MYLPKFNSEKFNARNIWINNLGKFISGNPVIVPDIGGPLEIIDNDCGISCDTRDIEQVINGISKILQDELNY